MIYITENLAPKYSQLSIDDWLSGKSSKIIASNETSTRTYSVERVSVDKLAKLNLTDLISVLSNFNAAHTSLDVEDKSVFYSTFYVQKKNKGLSAIIKNIYNLQNKRIGDTDAIGLIAAEIRRLIKQHPTSEDTQLKNDVITKCVDILTSRGFEGITSDMLAAEFKSAFRRIDAPDIQLKTALNELKRIFSELFGAKYHTAAHAYVEGRSTITAMQKHQQNKSRWFGKFDVSNFFGSVDEEFLLKMFARVYPFSEVLLDEDGNRELRKALSLCFLYGVLPQGTPISPMLTNILMIPMDAEISRALRDSGKKFVYTRYADDFLISSEYDFDIKNIEEIIDNVFAKFDAPLKLNKEKTRYGSSSGSNWNLGLMLNKDNQITVGYRNKRKLKATLFTYAKNKLDGAKWELGEVQFLNGILNYYKMVEKEVIDEILNKISSKTGLDIRKSIKEDLSA